MTEDRRQNFVCRVAARYIKDAANPRQFNKMNKVAV